MVKDTEFIAVSQTFGKKKYDQSFPRSNNAVFSDKSFTIE